jgi:hypothetical protein
MKNGAKKPRRNILKKPMLPYKLAIMSKKCTQNPKTFLFNFLGAFCHYGKIKFMKLYTNRRLEYNSQYISMPTKSILNIIILNLFEKKLIFVRKTGQK